MSDLVWTEKVVRLADLRPYEKNPRIIFERHYENLLRSLREHGYHSRIKTTIDRLVVGGHQRLRALKELGYSEIPVLVPNRSLTDREFRDILITDNLPFGEFDNKILVMDFTREELVDFGMEEPMLPAQEKFIIAKGGDAKDEDDIPLLQHNIITQPGDIWVLGSHRLMCGDCTNPSTIEAVLDGIKADLAFTSPPYGAGKSAKLRDHYIPGQKDRDSFYRSHEDSADGWLKLMNGWYTACLPHCSSIVGNIQLLADNKRDLLEWVFTKRDQLIDVIVWDKGHGAPQMQKNILNNEFEFIFIFGGNASRTIPFADWHGMVGNILRINPHGKNPFAKEHRAVMPVEVPKWIMGTLCPEAKTVIDPFCGLGTTLIAAQALGRCGFGVEIEPLYVDIAVRRWQNFTGQKAIKDGGGEFPG